MSDNDKSGLPRRRALLTTASVSSALIGLSTGAIATGQGSDNRPSNGNLPPAAQGGNRPSNNDLPPAAQENRPDEPPAAMGDVPDEWMDEEGNFTIPESELEKEFGVKVYDGRTGDELTDVETNVVNIKNDERISDHYSDDITIQGVRLEETLWSASTGGVSMDLRASFEFDLSRPEVSINLRIQANGIGFDLINFGVMPGDERLFCIEPQTHPTIPLDIALCPDLYWRAGTYKLDLGATGEACVGVDCPWTTCSFCRSISVNGTVDVEDRSITFD